MKSTTLIAFFIMALATASCGGDKDSDSKGSSSNPLTGQFTTQNGYYNVQSGVLEIGNQTYPPNQMYAQVMNMALQQAQMNQIQPVVHNGVQKLRAKITARLMNYNQPYNNQYNNQYNNPYTGIPNPGYNNGYNQNTLELQQVIFVNNF